MKRGLLVLLIAALGALAAPALARAPSATAGNATKITTTTVTLDGTVNLDNNPNGSYVFVYGDQKTQSQPVTLLTSGPVSADITGLDPAKTYKWNIELTAGGSTTESDIKSFTTLPLPPTATTGDATEISSTSARLAGTADTMKVQGKLSMILDDTTEVGATTRFGGDYNTVVTGLAPGSTHTYRMRAETTGGTALGDSHSFTTMAASATVTPTPTVIAPPTPSPSPTATPAPKPTLRVKATLKKLTVTISCGSPACSAKVKPKADKDKIAPRLVAAALLGSRTIKGGTKKKLTLPFTHAARRALRTLKAAAITVSVTFTYPDGTAVTKKDEVSLNKLLGGLSHGSER